MKNNIDKVYQLHRSFNLPIRENPQDIDKKEYDFRYELIKEELEEYFNACENNDKVEIADALGDMLYGIYGTILQHGMQYKINEVFDEIHKSNMSKLDSNGKPILREDGKIIKSDQYFKPNIQKIINDY